jgi:hypothetical protein
MFLADNLNVITGVLHGDRTHVHEALPVIMYVRPIIQHQIDYKGHVQSPLQYCYANRCLYYHCTSLAAESFRALQSSKPANEAVPVLLRYTHFWTLTPPPLPLFIDSSQKYPR